MASESESQVKRGDFSVTLDSDPVDSVATDLQDLTAKGRPEGLIETKEQVLIKLTDLQADPNSPLYSVKSFENLGLEPELLKGVYDMNFSKPSKIQERALPLLLADPPKNMIGQSQSGTGKTAAFVLTMLSRVDASLDAPQALCIAPSRELVRQILDVMQQMGKYTQIKVSAAIKDEGPPRGQKVTSQVVVGTPGTVTELIRRNQLNMRQLKLLVLDEADNMLDQQGLGDQSIRIKNMAPKTCQIVLFSATFAESVRKFAVRFAPNANEISLKVSELSVDAIKQVYMDCKDESHKLQVLEELYSVLTVSQSIIFVRKRVTADKIAKMMTDSGHKIVALHGQLDPQIRDQVMDGFRNGLIKVLVTTNVLARGIDISQINVVINYDIPVDGNGRPDAETYLHRIGRTGRFGRTGVAINFVHDANSFRELKDIQDYFGREIIKVETSDEEKMEKTLKKLLQ
ncbi:RNA helicase required for poly(A+) mRNA export [Dimargaris xerosporica]|nr:RNA helicase required for poly(A+) mRNA export [Dimargaris xerosporica]